MSSIPPIASFFGLAPSFLAGPAASSSMINQLLYGTSFQMVPINFGPPNPGIPPIFGGQGLTGLGTGDSFNIFSSGQILQSPFAAGGIFNNTGLTFPGGVFDPFNGNAAVLQPAFGVFGQAGAIPGLTIGNTGGLSSLGSLGLNSGLSSGITGLNSGLGFNTGLNSGLGFGVQSFGLNGLF